MTKIQNLKQKEMSKKTKQYDLEERTFEFAKDVRGFVKKLPRTAANIEDGKQLIRSSGSVGANYIDIWILNLFRISDFVLRILL